MDHRVQERNHESIRQMLNTDPGRNPSPNRHHQSMDKSNKPYGPYGLKPFKQAVFFDSSNGDGSKQLRVSFQRDFGSSAMPPPKTPSQLEINSELRLRSIKPRPEEMDPFVVPEPSRPRGQSDYIEKPQIDGELISRKGVYKRFAATLGDEGFPCKGCYDIYPTQYCLEDHLSRNSYTLTFECSYCVTILTFSNKCKLYYHLAEHCKDEAQIKHAVESGFEAITPLPKQQKTGPTDIVIPLKDPNQKPSPGSQATSPMETPQNLSMKKDSFESESLNVPKHESPTKTEPVESEKLDVEEPVSMEIDQSDQLKCLECNLPMRSYGELSAHFNISSTPVAPQDSICVPCQAVLPTACALKAHQRVHGMVEPFVCPECGIQMLKKNVFLKHLRLACLHYSKASEYTCPTCSETFSHEDEQIKHLKSNPAHLRFDGERSYFKCNGCPKAFKSAAAHSKHKTCPGAGCLVVHMCNNCPEQTVFRSISELRDHREKVHPHLKWVPKRMTIYNCYLCVHKSKNLASFCDHLLKEHQKKRIESMCHYCGIELENSENLEDHLTNCVYKQPSRPTTMICPAAVKRSNSYSNQPPIPVTKLEKISPPPEKQEKKEEPRPLCKPEIVEPLSVSVSDTAGSSTTASPQSAVSPPQPRINQQTFGCHMCATRFPTYVGLREHVKLSHGGQGLIYECWICREKGTTLNFYRQRNLDKHLSDIHKIQTTHNTFDTEEANSPVNGDEPAVKKMKIWGSEDEFQCCRCNYNSTQAKDFKDHIKQHNVQTDNVQCSECGMCFPVQLALRRHLFVVHKISDFAKYTQAQYVVDYEQRLNNANGACPVCELAIADNLRLKQHIRTHGMVYINTKI